MLVDYLLSSSFAVFICTVIYIGYSARNGFYFDGLKSFFTHIVATAVATGLALGSYAFFWPILSNSEDSQGPLAVFVLGPIGINAGLVLGAIVWLVRKILNNNSLKNGAHKSCASLLGR